MAPMSTETTRIVRNLIQGLVAGLLALVAAKTGGTVDTNLPVTDYLVALIFAGVLSVMPTIVDRLQAVPVVGSALTLLNGPRRSIEYVDPVKSTTDSDPVA